VQDYEGRDRRPDPQPSHRRARKNLPVTKMRHPVPEPILTQIGDITVSFALLESGFQSLAWSFIQDSQRIGQLITAELSFKNVRALALSLYRERHGDDADLATLRELLNRAADLEEKRNLIIHSVWATGEEEQTVTRIKATAKQRHGLRYTFTAVSADDLAAVADDIQRLAYDVQRFWINLIKRRKARNDPSDRLWP
jgi:hypothetical protein